MISERGFEEIHYVFKKYNITKATIAFSGMKRCYTYISDNEFSIFTKGGASVTYKTSIGIVKDRITIFDYDKNEVVSLDYDKNAFSNTQELRRWLINDYVQNSLFNHYKP
jgi:hypothetical protein